MTTAIGGYFGWSEQAGEGLPWLRTAVGYRSARCAIAAIARASGARRIWAPFYICSAVGDALASAGINVQRYHLSREWSIPHDIDPEPNDWILCVNYFGICSAEIGAALHRFGTRRVLVDASQSLFHRTCLNETAVYSPRKFIGVPDGGLAITPLVLPSPEPAIEEDSLARCAHLTTRASGNVEEGYRQFLAAEQSLAGCEAVAMSEFTKRRMACIDPTWIASRRTTNYRFLAKELRQRGFRVPQLPVSAVPLCCPVLDTEAVKLRAIAANEHIYTPTYWADAHLPADDEVALDLRDRTLYLPCDQRYTPDDLQRVVRLIEAATSLRSNRTRTKTPPGDQLLAQQDERNDKTRVLVFPCGSENAGEIHDALRYSVHVDLIGASSVDDHGRFRFTNYQGGLPNVSAPDFLLALSRLIHEKRIDLIFPTHDTVCEFLAENAAAVDCAIVNSDPEATRIARNKRLTLRVFDGEPWVPAIYPNPDDVPAWPAIVKPERGQGGQHVSLVRNPDEAVRVMALTPDPMLTEYLPGEEITVDCFTDRHRNLVFIGPRSRERVRAGISMRSQVLEVEKDVRTIANKINQQFRLRGPWFFQLKRALTGRWKLMEFSCRVAGSMVTQRARGVNLPLLAVLDYLNRDVIATPIKSIRLIDRAIITRAVLEFDFDNVFIDYDDTLVIDDNGVPQALAFLYMMAARSKRIILITRHAGDLYDSLARSRISSNLFDEIIHIAETQNKVDFVTARSIFIDNHYPERLAVARKHGIPVFDVDALEFLLR